MKRSIVRLFSQASASIDPLIWEEAASHHNSELFNLLYPKAASPTASRHGVRAHPIYNFIHQYYRFTPSTLLKYSPGVDIELRGVTPLNEGLLHPQYRSISSDGTSLSYCKDLLLRSVAESAGRPVVPELMRCQQMLKNSTQRSPFFACYGLHEWAMVYSQEGIALRPKQEKLNIRVSQQVINQTVEENPLRCTHFDAWRFFHPAAQPRNIHPHLSRATQLSHEQPGCIHNTMDLFRCAYLIYPLIPSELLRQTLVLATAARRLDLRASPYDVSAVEGCGPPVKVETAEGRREMIKLQEELYASAKPVRENLLVYYNRVLGHDK